MNPSKRYDAVVFDLDGTLVDSIGVCSTILRQMMRDRGLPGDGIDLPTLRRAISVGGTSMMCSLLGAVSNDPDADLREFRSRYQAHATPADSLYPGVRRTLHGLSTAGVRIGLCTKKPKMLAIKVLGDLGLLNAFGALSFGDTTVHPKPDPRHLQSVLLHLDVPMSKALMVGDSIVDFELARRAGVDFAFASHGYDDGSVPIDRCAIQLSRLDELVEACQDTALPEAHEPLVWG